PALWAAPLHWYGLHAAIVAEHLPPAQRLAEAAHHAAALADTAASSPYAAVLAVAASSWRQVMSGEIDPETVQAAARGLHGVGLAWEAARLAGQAATRTTDRRAMASLLTCARALYSGLPAGQDSAPVSGEELDDSDRGNEHAVEPAADETPTQPLAAQVPNTGRADGGDAEARSILSERELEVGRLILTGLTYKQIGERLFISAKTVEHHVARIRQRLGVASRGELFGRLRSLIDG
ncbi:MAG: response regulator transcription factor, partial [Pseudonocardiaceae bacterium]